jgi:flagellar FliL protein
MSILSSKTFKDIANLDGKQKLKEEISNGINNALGYPAVMNVYFTEFIVQ